MEADLHCHTKLSDGSLSIDELVLLAKRKGIPAISVTDHDTFAGSKRAEVFGARHGVEVVSGAEFSATDPETGRRAHILCYCCENTARLEGLCRAIGDNRRKAMQESMRKVLRLYPVTSEMIVHRAQGSTNVFKQHVMHALIDAGCTDEFYGEVYEKLFDPQSGMAYYPVEYPSVEEVIKRIHEAGGAAVLAHPAVYDSYNLLDRLTAKKLLDGVEVWHPRNNEGDDALLAHVAKRNNLAMTGGTDFHGMYGKPILPPGTCTTGDAQLKLLKEKAAKY